MSLGGNEMYDARDMTGRIKPQSQFRVGQEVYVLTNGERWRAKIVAYRGRLYQGRDFFDVTFGEVDEDGQLIVHGYPPERFEAIPA